jgi:hypothetical protein
MDLEETEARNDCAGESQQQSDWLIETKNHCADEGQQQFSSQSVIVKRYHT